MAKNNITIDDLAGIVKSEFDKTNKEIKEVKTELGKVKATMATKNYLDEKLTDLRGDLVVLMRKEDNKMRIEKAEGHILNHKY